MVWQLLNKWRLLPGQQLATGQRSWSWSWSWTWPKPITIKRAKINRPLSTTRSASTRTNPPLSQLVVAICRRFAVHTLRSSVYLSLSLFFSLCVTKMENEKHCGEATVHTRLEPEPNWFKEIIDFQLPGECAAKQFGFLFGLAIFVTAAGTSCQDSSYAHTESAASTVQHGSRLSKLSLQGLRKEEALKRL